MSARAWLLFGAVSVVWGVPYFFIKVAVDAAVPPGFVAGPGSPLGRCCCSRWPGGGGRCGG